MAAEEVLALRPSRPFLWAALALLALGLVPADSWGQLLGPEFQVNSYTVGDQGNSRVAARRTGEFVVVWSSDLQDGERRGVFGRLFGPDDQPLGEEFQVNQYTSGSQDSPRVAMDGGGQFMVTWSNDGYRQTIVPARRYDASGLPAGGEFQVASDTTWISAFGSEVTTDAAGNFLVLWGARFPIPPPWPQPIGGTSQIQRYSGAGEPLGAAYVAPGATVASTGTFEVALGTTYWEDLSGDVLPHAAVQRYGPQGAAGPVVQVDSDPRSWILSGQTQVASSGEGDFIAAWSAGYYFINPPIGAEVFMRRVSATSGLLGESAAVNSYTTGHQYAASLAVDRQGNFLVVWQSQDQDGSGTGIFGQRFAADGSALGGEFQVNSYTTGEQEAPSVAAGNVGDFIVSWTSAGQDGSGSGVFARRIRSSIFWGGFELGNPCGWSSVAGASCP